jgi:hypothetical protein
MIKKDTVKKQKRNQKWVQEYFFLVVPLPKKDELLSSWLLRLAFAHERIMTTFISLFIKQDGSKISAIDIDFRYYDELFDVIATKSNLDKKQILQMSLRSEEGYLYHCNDCLYPPKQIRKLLDKRTHNGLLYCPKCLKEDEIPYWRKHWRYWFYNACTKHNVFLTDRCWVCYEPIKLYKMQNTDGVVYCGKCGNDLRDTVSVNVSKRYNYGMEAIRWFENGLQNGYLMIGEEKVHSLWIFESATRLQWLLDRKDDLVLDGFPLLDEYKQLCKELDNYNSKKAKAVYKDFLLNAMIYFLFQDFPKNLLDFARQNNLTYREFTHGFKEIPFWYKEMIGELIPMQNKIGREISESEVIGAINYLKSIGVQVTKVEVANIVGCHYSIHKGFAKIYHSIKEVCSCSIF